MKLSDCDTDADVAKATEILINSATERGLLVEDLESRIEAFTRYGLSRLVSSYLENSDSGLELEVDGLLEVCAEFNNLPSILSEFGIDELIPALDDCDSDGYTTDICLIRNIEEQGGVKVLFHDINCVLIEFL